MALIDRVLEHVPDNGAAKAIVVAGFLPAVAHELVYIVLGAPMALYYGLLAWREFRNKGGDHADPGGQHH